MFPTSVVRLRHRQVLIVNGGKPANTVTHLVPRWEQAQDVGVGVSAVHGVKGSIDVAGDHLWLAETGVERLVGKLGRTEDAPCWQTRHQPFTCGWPSRQRRTATSGQRCPLLLLGQGLTLALELRGHVADRLTGATIGTL